MPRLTNTPALPLTLIMVLFSVLAGYAQNQEKGMKVIPYNYHTFSAKDPVAANEAEHPEKDKLPYNAPCTSCREDIAQRTESSRVFYGTGSEEGKI